MIPKFWFRFGIPLGSGTVLAGLLDLALSSYWSLNFIGSFFHSHIWDNKEPIDIGTIFGFCTILLRFLLTLSLWGFILLGTRGILLVWLPLSIIADCLLITLAVYNTTHDAISDEVWFLNLSVVVILRFYITIVIIQALRRLLQNAKVEAEMNRQSITTKNSILEFQQQPNEVELQEIMTNSNTNKQPVINGNGSPSPTLDENMIIVLDRNVHDNTKNNKNDARINTLQQGPGNLASGPRFRFIDPIGESASQLWVFYHDTPRLGAAMMVMFELIWNIFTLSTHSLTEYFLGGKLFFMINQEEIFMRIWRIVVAFVALIFIFKRRKTLLRFWLIVYFWTLFVSLSIFVYTVSYAWMDPPPIQIFIVWIIFLGDNLIRFSVVYFILRTTIQPPAITPTSDLSPSGHGQPKEQQDIEEGGAGIKRGSNIIFIRSHSLRSQTGPRIKRNSLTKSIRRKSTKRLHRMSDNSD